MSIGLTKDQQHKMDAIFNKNKPAVLDKYNGLQMEQSKGCWRAGKCPRLEIRAGNTCRLS
jgi:hypothetical protein